MTIRAGFFSKSQKFAVTNIANAFTVGGVNESKHAYLVQSDVVVHITRDGTDATVDTGFRIPADTPVLINTVAGDVISFVTGTGESNGSVWFASVDH